MLLALAYLDCTKTGRLQLLNVALIDAMFLQFIYLDEKVLLSTLVLLVRGERSGENLFFFSFGKLLLLNNLFVISHHLGEISVCVSVEKESVCSVWADMPFITPTLNPRIYADTRDHGK